MSSAKTIKGVRGKNLSVNLSLYPDAASTEPTHTFLSDVPLSQGGDDLAPDPHDYLEGALAACTIMTVQMYANRKQWPLESTEVFIHIESENKEGTVIVRDVKFHGPLTAEQRDQLYVIANKCPIHRLLLGKIEIKSKLMD
ncbi:MAG: OsmC family protein [Bdellovibrionales bacterium]|jgi:putative redox protein|nr:OsmC family protein [Bdellovibrionales bacterium]